jgi:hypothetical protein
MALALLQMRLHLHHDGFFKQHETEQALQKLKLKPTLHPMEEDK